MYKALYIQQDEDKQKKNGTFNSNSTHQTYLFKHIGSEILSFDLIASAPGFTQKCIYKKRMEKMGTIFLIL